MFGLTETILLEPSGVWMLAASVAGCGVIYYVIDPKLRAASDEYEGKQAAYLDDVERAAGGSAATRKGARL